MFCYYVLFFLVHRQGYGLTVTCADPESFVRGGPILTCFLFIYLFIYFFDEGREDQNSTESGPLLTRHRRFAGVPMMAQY